MLLESRCSERRHNSIMILYCRRPRLRRCGKRPPLLRLLRLTIASVVYRAAVLPGRPGRRRRRRAVNNRARNVTGRKSLARGPGRRRTIGNPTTTIITILLLLPVIGTTMSDEFVLLTLNLSQFMSLHLFHPLRPYRYALIAFSFPLIKMLSPRPPRRF